MKILITSLGTFGDIKPMLNLADALGTIGHQITFAATQEWRDICKDKKVSYYEIPYNFTSLLKEKTQAIQNRKAKKFQ